MSSAAADLAQAPARIVVLASGRGTNLQALIDACDGGPLAGTARVVAVLSDNASAQALERARRHGIEASFVAPPQRGLATEREAWDIALAERIAATEPDVIVLAGWMRILGPAFIARFPDPRRPKQARILNLHPGLPGELPGKDAIAKAHAEAERGLRKESGVMVHVVVAEVDAGPVIACERVPMAPGMSLDAFAEAMHAVEHRLIVDAVVAFLRAPTRHVL